MTTEASALVSARRSRQSSYYKCGHCGKDGHASERCCETFPDQAPESWKPRNKKSSSSAFVTNYCMSGKIMEEVDHVCLLSSSSSSRVTTKSESWIIDSGCTSHMTFDRCAFSSYTQVLGQTVQMGTKATDPVPGKGSVVINIMTNGSLSTLKLANFLHLPSFKFQPLSVSQMDRCTFSTRLKNMKALKLLKLLSSNFSMSDLPMWTRKES